MSNYIKTGLSALIVLSVCCLWSTPQYGNRDVPEFMDVSIGYMKGMNIVLGDDPSPSLQYFVLTER